MVFQCSPQAKRNEGARRGGKITLSGVSQRIFHTVQWHDFAAFRKTRGVFVRSRKLGNSQWYRRGTLIRVVYVKLLLDWIIVAFFFNQLGYKSKQQLFWSRNVLEEWRHVEKARCLFSDQVCRFRACGGPSLRHNECLQLICFHESHGLLLSRIQDVNDFSFPWQLLLR